MSASEMPGPLVPPTLTLKLSKKNADIVNRYLIEMEHEGHSWSYRHCGGLWVSRLALHVNNKPFKKIVRNDILSFLDTFEVSEDIDPNHRWIGAFNNIRMHVMRFIKWLYNPKLPAKVRAKLKPKVIDNIPLKTRRDGELYDATKLWTDEEVALFLKYSKSARDRCYVMMANDASARPHELLNLKIKDIEPKITSDGKHYAIIRVSGKTGSRTLPLTDSLPYIKDWIIQHPQSGNENAILICSNKKNKMLTRSLAKIFYLYKSKYFPELLDTDIPYEDKVKIRTLLKKPFNPYIWRHTSLTDKSKKQKLSDAELQQIAGWSRNSKMHNVYVHYFGNEAVDTILRQKGILPKEGEIRNIFKTKECPECKNLNSADARYCSQCKMVLSYRGFEEVRESEEKKEQQLQDLTKTMEEIKTQSEQSKRELHEMFESYKQDARQLIDLEVEKNRQKFRQQLSDAVKRTGKKPEMVMSEKIDEFILNSPKDLEEPFMKLNPVYKSLALDEVRALKDEIEKETSTISNLD